MKNGELTEVDLAKIRTALEGPNIGASLNAMDKTLKEIGYLNGETLRAEGFRITVGQVLEIEGQKIAATKNQTLILLSD